MRGIMVDIQSATAEIGRGKKIEERRKKKPQDENIISASATQGGHNDIGLLRAVQFVSERIVEATGHACATVVYFYALVICDGY